MEPAVPAVALPGGVPPRMRERDRLGATLVLSGAVHALAILGIGFAIAPPAPIMPMLEVIRTPTTTPMTPRQADFMAQASNDGGGEHDVSSRPAEPVASRVPLQAEGQAPAPQRAQSPSAAPAPPLRVAASTTGRDNIVPVQRRPQAELEPLPPGPRKVAYDMEMARLAAEIHLNSERYAKRPKRKFVSASTQEYAYAEYLRRWVERAERVGNLNYPEAARQRGLSGQVVMSIGIRRDGRVESATVVKSSGQPILDQAALRIARIAEPYPPLPRTVDEIDVLNVVRTWHFHAAGTFEDE